MNYVAEPAKARTVASRGDSVEMLASIGVSAAVVGGLYLSSLYSYLLFHSLIEISTVVVAFALFVLTWNTRKYFTSSFLKIVGIGYLFCALIDFVHTLAYKGMNVFHGYGANLPTQLWIAARCLQAATLVLALLLKERKVNNGLVCAGFAVQVPLLLWAVFTGVFPDCFIEGKGLTAFKIRTEYVISLVLTLALVAFWRSRKQFENRVARLITFSIVCTIFSELVFTQFTNLYAPANMLGHYFKLAAFYLVYRSILVTGLQDPFALVFRDLGRSNEALRQAHQETEVLLNSVPSLLIGLDADAHIWRWNRAATAILGWDENKVSGATLDTCGVRWITREIDSKVTPQANPSAQAMQCVAFEKNGEKRFLHITGVALDPNGKKSGSLVVGTDATEQIFLEGQLNEVHKLEAVGQLAAGIAHEINTPTQFVLDNITFLKDSLRQMIALLECCQLMPARIDKACPDSSKVLADFDARMNEFDFEYQKTEIPKAVEEALEGLGRVRKIVQAMKAFSHPGSSEKSAENINRAIETTITVAKNEWKYVADAVTRFDDTLPPVPCLLGEFNQAILNLLINAAHAIGSVVTEDSPKGVITITTKREEEFCLISIHDTGHGIPDEIKSRIFEPFFTTKPLGKGTGQGLSLAHATVVKRHQGQIWFESESGQGTTFFIRLPLQVEPTAEAGKLQAGAAGA